MPVWVAAFSPLANSPPAVSPSGEWPTGEKPTAGGDSPTPSLKFYVNYILTYSFTILFAAIRVDLALLNMLFAIINCVLRIGFNYGMQPIINRECTVKKESARWRSQYGLPETELPMQQHGSRKVPRINLLIIKV